jgi:hypothetical protein
MPIAARPDYVLQAVQPGVCTTGMLANFNQALEAWWVMPTCDLCRLQVSSHWPTVYKLPLTPVSLRLTQLLLTE